VSQRSRAALLHGIRQRSPLPPPCDRALRTPEAVGARGPRAVDTNGFHGFTEEVGGGEDFLVAGLEQEDEQGL
jgi:hypothetical protein